MTEPAEIAQVQDKRPKITGLMPRNAQALVLGGIALLMVLTILFSGHNAPKPVPAVPAGTNATVEPNPTRIQDYRSVIDDQLRKLGAEEAELARTKQALGSNAISAAPLHSAPSAYGASPSVSQQDEIGSWIEKERRKREYESVFASNLALSYRSADPKRGPEAATSSPSAAAVSPGGPTASARYRLFEGTFLETVLTNRLDSSFSGPLNCMVTTKVYSHDGQALLIPDGTRVLGEVRKLESFGEQRLAVFFHRLIMPDGYSVNLDQFKGLDQIGETGLRDQVNHHYLQVFGVSLAIGAIAGLAQSNTRYGVEGSAAEVYEQGVTNSLSQSALHILDRYLNVLPTFTIREGCRIKIYLSQDMVLPAFDQHPAPNDL